ncbi:MurR/RpiR family transcriptional regulator [Aeromicrobium sp.]|uniref:MurR/RpiR family transcriptional regulator n=1 Tax=Aeromicrobium sp. TaxID=1871063 RepID=UPI0028AA85C2|nr:MurR/RpiR family transcriptional regulator [Aeromicrobium sp.]
MASEPEETDERQVSERLRTHEDRFTKAERKVARVLHAEYPRAGLESLPTLAKRAQVSSPTVLRLITKLGYGGYGDFQAALLEEVNERMSVPAGRAVEHGGRLDDLSEGFGQIVDAVAGTDGRTSRTEFARIVELLARASGSIYTVGGFESEFCSLHLANLLGQVRPGVRNLGRVVASAPFEVLDMRRGDVLVAFDFRRYQSRTMQLCRQAAEQKAAVVVVTDPWLSPASAQAEHVLVCDSSGPGPFDSRASVVAVVEVLVSEVTALLGEHGSRRIAEVYELMAGSTWAESLVVEGEEGDAASEESSRRPAEPGRA